MKQQIYQNGFYLLIGLIVGFLIGTWMYYQPVKTDIQIQTQPIEKVKTFDGDSIKGKPNKQVVALNDANLMKELIRQKVKHPEIVLAQAKLETGFYTSDVCRKNNNLFGLRHKNGYYKFKTWQQSVTAYRDYVQYKWDGKTDYLVWLDRIGYASAPDYTELVQSLI